MTALELCHHCGGAGTAVDPERGPERCPVCRGRCLLEVRPDLLTDGAVVDTFVAIARTRAARALAHAANLFALDEGDPT